MRRLVVLCMVTSVTLLGATGGRAVAGDSRCDALREVVPVAIGALTGAVEGADEHARTLRDLSRRELVPARVKPALRKLARFLEDVADLDILERAQQLAVIARPLGKLVLYSTQICGLPTTTTTRPLR